MGNLQVTLFVSRMDASGVSCQWPLAKSPRIQTPILSHVNLKKERSVCIFFTLEGRGYHNVKRVMRRGRGWVRKVRVSSLSSRYNIRKAQPFGIDFDFCRPIPSHVNLKKERSVCIFFTLEGRGDHNVKRVMRRSRGWVRTTPSRVASLSSRYNSRKAAVAKKWVRVRKSRIKGG
ncbi:hypothetical protein DAPPUDRAFT_98166 [Daphnia pulex]|uniref:Uncharacterized protein n=1 Tax=Daphnia pulex TaxID=6669 RepID=E9G2I6_DAPPU|nr:hypothetical protein DAPPUDRAFT_98166 [Daphnia pulex]|eukprot:EFX86258.1 hypothetical protein DAPPUDRAFT_98166 [Daphnia pulex]